MKQSHEQTYLGILNYHPVAKSTESKPWWAILDCCPDLGKYYRWMYWQYYRERLQIPAWGTHISAIRGEEPTNKGLWGQFEGSEIPFRTNGILMTDGTHFWLQVECDRLLEIRELLGLPRFPYFDLHVTVGVVG